MSKLFIVYRIDRTDGKAAAIRAEIRPLHRDYMMRFGTRVRAGGPLLDPQGTPLGGMMIIEADNEDEVRRIVAEDPFEKAALSERIEIAEFRWQTNRPADLPLL
ncbi:MAG: YciI family protein [Betaproteobacteria bacterium]|nr:YciI family protein [Betaproteobacteria bacterium]